MSKKLIVALMLFLALAIAACATPTQQSQPTAVLIPTETAAPTEAAPEAEPTDAPPAEISSAEADLRTFAIVPERSEVRFVIDEVLRGTPTTVVGVNSGVSGDLTVDLANPANTQIGPIEIDAAGFVTDDDRRNGAIRRFILVPDRYPTVTFAPTAISGLPESASVGDRFDFQVVGDLTILDSTHPVTFDLSANVISESEVAISGATTINRADFGISIPSVPFVASVAEEMRLELDLVSVAQ